MPVYLKGKKFYRTSEVYKDVGIGRATLYRWLKAGVLRKTYRDRRGWRLYTEKDISRIRKEVGRIRVTKEK